MNRHTKMKSQCVHCPEMYLTNTAPIFKWKKVGTSDNSNRGLQYIIRWYHQVKKISMINRQEQREEITN